MTKQMKSKISQLAAKLAEELNPSRWANIDQLRDIVTRDKLIDIADVGLQGEVWNWFTGEIIRKAMRRKDDEGFPLFPSIRQTRRDGSTERQYIRERQMKPLHYGEFYRECRRAGKYWNSMADAAAGRCVSRYGPQGDLFPGWTEEHARKRA